MSLFRFSTAPLQTEPLRAELGSAACGAYVAFEGWVRNHNEGRSVVRLEYEAFAPLAVREGERILATACERFGVERALCVHRIGELGIGEIAVWVGGRSYTPRRSFSVLPLHHRRDQTPRADLEERALR
jgi:molybdopterin synthase catalytic subunit